MSAEVEPEEEPREQDQEREERNEELDLQTRYARIHVETALTRHVIV